MTIRGLTFSWPILLAGIGLAGLLLLLKWLEARFLIINYALDLYISSLAIVFTLLGIWLSNRLFKQQQTIVIEKEIPMVSKANFVANEKELLKLSLSPREREVLLLMAEGLSNQEIAGRLFVSLNTVKTHGSNLLSKMEVKRRTQAIDKAKKLGIIP